MGITGTQNLHYPDATDFVEDHSTNLEVLARQVDARMRSHDLDVIRGGEGRPMCVLDAVAPQTIVLNSGNQFDAMVKFDTVRFDTDGMANLDVEQHSMTFQTRGYYALGFYGNIPSSGCVAGTGAALWQAGVNLNIIPRPSLLGDRFNQVTDGNNGWVPGNISCVGIVSTLPLAWGWATAGVTGTNCATTLTVNFARLWAFKIRDYP